jgi:hypothetical protein
MAYKVGVRSEGLRMKRLAGWFILCAVIQVGTTSAQQTPRPLQDHEEPDAALPLPGRNLANLRRLSSRQAVSRASVSVRPPPEKPGPFVQCAANPDSCNAARWKQVPPRFQIAPRNRTWLDSLRDSLQELRKMNYGASSRPDTTDGRD